MRDADGSRRVSEDKYIRPGRAEPSMFFTDDDDSEFGENASVREADLLKQQSAVRTANCFTAPRKSMLTPVPV